jgi:hypothetical protein
LEAVPPSYKGSRYPGEVIAHCVWLYHRFPLSFREVEELMLEDCFVCGQFCGRDGVREQRRFVATASGTQLVQADSGGDSRDPG